MLDNTESSRTKPQFGGQKSFRNNALSPIHPATRNLDTSNKLEDEQHDPKVYQHARIPYTLFELYENEKYDSNWQKRTDPPTKQTQQLDDAMMKSCNRRKVAVLSDDSICLLLRLSQLSDVVVVVHRSIWSLALKPKGEEYLFLGIAMLMGLCRSGNDEM